MRCAAPGRRPVPDDRPPLRGSIDGRASTTALTTLESSPARRRAPGDSRSMRPPRDAPPKVPMRIDSNPASSALNRTRLPCRGCGETQSSTGRRRLPMANQRGRSSRGCGVVTMSPLSLIFLSCRRFAPIDARRAERVGFEPTVPEGTHALQACLFSQTPAPLRVLLLAGGEGGIRTSCSRLRAARGTRRYTAFRVRHVQPGSATSPRRRPPLSFAAPDAPASANRRAEGHDSRPCLPAPGNERLSHARGDVSRLRKRATTRVAPTETVRCRRPGFRAD